MAKRTARKTKKKTARKTTRRAGTRRTATKKTTRKKTARKTTARKKTARKTTARKTAAKAGPKPAKITGSRGKARTKSEIYSIIADHVGITKKEAAGVFDVMGEMIAADLKKGSVGTFNVPGMMKVLVQRKPATKARKGTNPFTGEEMIFKAKPARNVVKVRPLKGLKDRVA